jgi:hypothetical protein
MYIFFVFINKKYDIIEQETIDIIYRAPTVDILNDNIHLTIYSQSISFVKNSIGPACSAL